MDFDTVKITSRAQQREGSRAVLAGAAVRKLSGLSRAARQLANHPDADAKREEMAFRAAGGNLAPPVDIPVDIYVDEPGAGELLIKINDLYSGSGVARPADLTGPAVTLEKLDGEPQPPVSFQASDDWAEIATGPLPAGLYEYRVTAPRHRPESGRVEIKPGPVQTLELLLVNELVTFEWSVEPVGLQDRYQIVVTATYDTRVPAPRLVITPETILLPEMKPGDVFAGDLLVENKGFLRAEEIEFHPPVLGDGYLVEIPGELPEMMEPGQFVRLPYRVTRLAAAQKTGDPGGQRAMGGDCSCAGGCGYVKYVTTCPGATGELLSLVHITSPCIPCGTSHEPDGGDGGIWHTEFHNPPGRWWDNLKNLARYKKPKKCPEKPPRPDENKCNVDITVQRLDSQFANDKPQYRDEKQIHLFCLQEKWPALEQLPPEDILKYPPCYPLELSFNAWFSSAVNTPDWEVETWNLRTEDRIPNEGSRDYLIDSKEGRSYAKLTIFTPGYYFVRIRGHQGGEDCSTTIRIIAVKPVFTNHRSKDYRDRGQFPVELKTLYDFGEIKQLMSFNDMSDERNRVEITYKMIPEIPPDDYLLVVKNGEVSDKRKANNHQYNGVADITFQHQSFDSKDQILRFVPWFKESQGNMYSEQQAQPLAYKILFFQLKSKDTNETGRYPFEQGIRNTIRQEYWIVGEAQNDGILTPAQARDYLPDLWLFQNGAPPYPGGALRIVQPLDSGIFVSGRGYFSPYELEDSASKVNIGRMANAILGSNGAFVTDSWRNPFRALAHYPGDNDVDVNKRRRAMNSFHVWGRAIDVDTNVSATAMWGLLRRTKALLRAPGACEIGPFGRVVVESY